MSLAIRVLAVVLLLVTVVLSAKQGWAMLTNAPAAGELLRKLGLGQPGQVVLGSLVLLGAGLTLVPATFVGGSFLSAACILLLLVLQLHQHNLAGAALEVPFLVLALVVVYLRHPLAK